MSNISPTVKFSFAIILVLGIGISILVTFFEEASGGYLAQVVSEEESEEVDAEVVMPIVQEVSLSSAGAYTITVTATDGVNSAQKTFNINVNDISQNKGGFHRPS